MCEVRCPGLPASWINAWLAAVGATVLDSRIRLRWTAKGAPLAVLSAERVDPVAALAASWPVADIVDDLPIAERWNDTPPLPRKVSLEAFCARARATRGHPFSWALSSTMTDLVLDANGDVVHAPFDPAGPGTIKWLHHRLQKLHRQVEPSVERLMDTFSGRAERIKDNGLGFDLTRMGSQADASGMAVDPVIEVLAFFGLALLPVRGAGIDAAGSSFPAPAVQRGWHRVPGPRHEYRFTWPAWSASLDDAGIDALLDVWSPDDGHWPSISVHAAWQSVPFKGRGSSDRTRGFGSARLSQGMRTSADPAEPRT